MRAQTITWTYLAIIRQENDLELCAMAGDCPVGLWGWRLFALLALPGLAVQKVVSEMTSGLKAEISDIIKRQPRRLGP